MERIVIPAKAGLQKRTGLIVLGVLVMAAIVSDTYALIIESPTEGQTIVVGEDIEWKVRPAPNEVCKSVAEGTSFNSKTGRYEWTERITPDEELGQQRFIIMGEPLHEGGSCLDATVNVTVVLPPTTVVESISAHDKGDPYDKFIPLRIVLDPQKEPIFKSNSGIEVDGIYSDGVKRDISSDPKTVYQSLDEKIATVTVKEGKAVVAAVGPGKTEILVSHGPNQDRIEIKVREFICQPDTYKDGSCP